jgi:hypothetical protein
MLNRVALTITRKQPYVDWANGTDGPVPVVAYPEDDLRTVYLAPVGDREPDLAGLLERFWEEVFEAELSMWMVDESTWPHPRTREMFDEWFDAEVDEGVVDLVPDEPLSEDEVEDAAIQYALEHCSWCDLELKEGQPRRAVGLAMLDRESFSFREGLTFVMATSDRFLTGIMTTRDSPAARDHMDVVFSACSSRCEKIIRKEATRALKRMKKSANDLY